jgi:S1-C subfamily serine protease
MDDPSRSRTERWRSRLSRLRGAARRALPFVAGMLVVLAALLLYNMFFPGPRQLTSQDVNEAVAQALASATPAPPFSEQVYQVIRPSLVLIQTDLPDKDGKPQHGVGSGVIIDDQGDILTSLHVVDQSTDIQLIFADGTQSGAEVADKQPEHDIAVLRATNPPAQLVPAVLGNPNAMQVGDEAYVVGNPFGLYSSMSAGVISGFDRTFESPENNVKLKGLIQIDAAVNPGNSGGPLLNRAGQVIGIVEGIANPDGQDVFIGIGFAVPINVAAAGAGLPPY